MKTVNLAYNNIYNSSITKLEKCFKEISQLGFRGAELFALKSRANKIATVLQQLAYAFETSEIGNLKSDYAKRYQTEMEGVCNYLSIIANRNISKKNFVSILSTGVETAELYLRETLLFFPEEEKQSILKINKKLF